jgi:hypothetical protein
MLQHLRAWAAINPHEIMGGAGHVVSARGIIGLIFLEDFVEADRSFRILEVQFPLFLQCKEANFEDCFGRYWSWQYKVNCKCACARQNAVSVCGWCSTAYTPIQVIGSYTVYINNTHYSTI